jgi:hypothetical protein
VLSPQDGEQSGVNEARFSGAFDEVHANTTLDRESSAKIARDTMQYRESSMEFRRDITQYRASSMEIRRDTVQYREDRGVLDAHRASASPNGVHNCAISRVGHAS